MDVRTDIGWNCVSYTMFIDINLPLYELRDRLTEVETMMVAAGATPGSLELQTETESDYGYERVITYMRGNRPLTRAEKAAAKHAEKKAKEDRAAALRAELARLEA